MKNRRLLRLRLTATTTAAGKYRLLSDPVDPGEVWCLQHVTWEVDLAMSGGNDRVRLAIVTGGYDSTIEEQKTPTANVIYTYQYPEWLYEGERLLLELDQAQTATTVQLHARGYRSDIGDGG